MNAPSRNRTLLGAGLALALATGHVLAEPKQEHGKGGKPAAQHGQPMNHNQPGKPQGQNGAHGQPDGQMGKGGQRPQHGGYQDAHGHDGVSVHIRAPQINVTDVRSILIGHRGLLAPADNLPPGIRQNLARGKPLPPGIAKNVDPRLLGRLPHYEGYEWKQVGRDILLVAVATGIIYTVLDNILD